MATLRTVTVKSSGGDYSSLNAAEAGEQGDMVALDRELGIECYSFNDTTTVAFNGWTTDATRFVRVYTPASERHDGKWNTAKYRLEVAGTVLTVQEENVRLDGLQVFMTNTASSFLYGIILSGITGVADFRIENCLVRASDEIGANCNGVYLAAAGAGSVVRMKNTAVYGFYSTGDFDAALRGGTANITAYLYNCVFVRGNYGVLSNPGVFNCTNCYAGATDHGAYVIGGGSGGTINRTTSASSDATGSAGLQNIAYSTTAGAYFANITVGSEDFHIGASSALKDVGTDLSADANYAFTDDIDGQTRSGTWDIGADEYVAAGGTNYTRTLSDAVSVNDSAGTARMRNRFIAEQISLTEELIRSAVRGRVVLESLSVGDALARSVAHGRVLSDSISITDALARREALLYRLLVDNVDVYEALSRTISGGAIIMRMLVDSVDVFDSLLRMAHLFRRIEERVDSQDVLLRYQTANRQLLDSIAVSVATIRSMVHGRVASDSVGLYETVFREVWLRRVLTDSVEVADLMAQTLTVASQAIGFVLMELSELGKMELRIAEPVAMGLRQSQLITMRLGKYAN